MPPLDPLVGRAESLIKGFLGLGLPYREVARRSGASRAQVYDVATGRAHLSQARAELVTSRLDDTRRWLVNVATPDGRKWYNPTSQKAYGLAMEHEKALEKVAEGGARDLSPLKKYRGKSITVVKTGGGTEKIRLLDDRDGDTIRRLMNTDQLLSDTVTHGGSNVRRVK